MRPNIKSMPLRFAAIVVVSVVLVHVLGESTQAFTIDWSGCGAGSMCTNEGYICVQQ